MFISAVWTLLIQEEVGASVALGFWRMMAPEWVDQYQLLVISKHSALLQQILGTGFTGFMA
jgi:folate-dependent phosphoribosylglycinamide formyltransferase PurN